MSGQTVCSSSSFVTNLLAWVAKQQRTAKGFGWSERTFVPR